MITRSTEQTQDVLETEVSELAYGLFLEWGKKNQTQSDLINNVG